MHPIQVTADTFDSLVLQQALPVVVDFWADWCGPCLSIAPKLEELQAHYDGRLVIAKVNRDDNEELAQKYEVEGIPHLLFFHQGKVTGRQVGNAPLEQLRIYFDDFLAATGDKSVLFPSDEATASFAAAVVTASGIRDEAHQVAATAYQAALVTEYAALDAAKRPIVEAAEQELSAQKEALGYDEYQRQLNALCAKLSTEERFAEAKKNIDVAVAAFEAAEEPYKVYAAAASAAESVFNESVAAARIKFKG